MDIFDLLYPNIPYLVFFTWIHLNIFQVQNAGRLPVSGLLANIQLAGRRDEKVVLYVVDLTVSYEKNVTAIGNKKDLRLIFEICLTLSVPTPQNGQTNSNNSSATADELFECV